MKKSVITALTIISIFGYIYGQNEYDALRYSMNTFGGTARFMSTGSAFGALGADPSSLSLNPAGIALYKKSEFTFTPSIYQGNSKTNYNGRSSSDMKFNYNFSNLGLIGTFNTESIQNRGWAGFVFGIALNRQNNFHNSIDIIGERTNTSLLDVFTSTSYNVKPKDLDPFGSGLAFDTWLIDTIPDTNIFIYQSVIPHNNQKIEQRKSIYTKGAMMETALSFGGNYNDMFCFGLSFGFPFVRYIEESTYKEIDKLDSIHPFSNFVLNEYLETYGSGFNFKIGFLIKPIDFLRLGVAVHTPTYFSMQDEFNSKIKAKYDTGAEYEATSPEGKFDYELITPLKAIGSIAFVINKFGFISADVEAINYAEARLRSSSFSFFDQNDAIKSKFRDQLNYRIGCEYNLSPFALRAGFNYYGSPYKKEFSSDSKYISYTGGIGYRIENFFLDFAYVYGTTKENYDLYYNVGIPVSITKFSHNFLITTGFRF